MNRSLRRMWSWLALIAVVFAQLSVAAYACPSAQVEMVAASAPCDSAPMPDPNLCQKHCSDHQQSGPTVLAPAPFAASFVAFLERDAASVLPEPPVAALAHPISPPLIVSHCCWRI